MKSSNPYRCHRVSSRFIHLFVLACLVRFLSAATGIDTGYDNTVIAQTSKPEYWDQAIDFTANLSVASNLEGQVKGEVMFLQNTRVGPNRSEQQRPLLVTHRGALLVFTPEVAEDLAYRAFVWGPDRQSNLVKLQAPGHGPRSDFKGTSGRPPVVYSKRAWMGVIPWNLVRPGMSVIVQDSKGRTGTLPASSFELGAPMELVAQHVEIGMLVEPVKVPVNEWARPDRNVSPELAIDYFQMVPVARFVAAQYLPIHFPKVVMPNGNVYTERSTYEGAGIYKGDMREAIAKGMVSTGINLAGVGITSSYGGNQRQPRPYRQTTVHTSAGMYVAKDKDGNETTKMFVHGLSGGGGQLTLRNTRGNEYSHEYGHDHGLGHYPGGVLSTHRRDGAWGFHEFKHRLIANISWNGKAPSTQEKPEPSDPKDSLTRQLAANSNDAAETQLPYAFGKDAMAGGAPMGPLSPFTLHTPYSLKLIQANLTKQSGILDAESPTGYSRWDAEQQSLVPHQVTSPKPDSVGIPVMTLVGFYDPAPGHMLTSFIFPALYGNWGNVFLPRTIEANDPELAKSKCRLEVTDADGRVLRFPLHDQRIKPKLMNQLHVNLDASKTYVKAAIVFAANDTDTTLAERDIVPPHGELPDPVIVGKDHRFTAASQRLRDMAKVFPRNGYPNRKALDRAMVDYYGPISDYRKGERVFIGRVYRVGKAYYQATVTKADSGDTQRRSVWRNLGTVDDFVSSVRLELGESSVDYAKQVMKGKSGVFYYVPVDNADVIKSDHPTPKSRQWYAKGKHSTITVRAKRDDGSFVPMVIRGRINNRHAVNRGAPVNESSRVRFTYHAEDNPDVTAGTYDIRFSAYAHGWHTNKLIEAFEVFGKVEVK